ncbi:MAG: energy transducer TonB [Bdellovibrionaceae bacterium]|nr:energy transducer TonB [Pseudobdellovibrionaceae bacterium]
MRADRYLPLALALSLIVHLTTVGIVWFIPDRFLHYFNPPPVSQIQVEKPSLIEVILKDKEPTKQIVRQADAPENLVDETKTYDPTRFLSEKRQRVLLETQAREVGKTQNRTAKIPRYQQQLLEKKIQQELRSIADADGDFAVNTNHNDNQYRPVEIFPREQYMRSTVGESLPNDVSVGDFTALNTDQYQFYTFYARVEDLVRFRWETRIRNAIDDFDRRKIIKGLSQKTWITQIEFLIDPQGHLKKAILLKESGIPQFDLSSVRAFEDAKVFPNPPKEMIQSDGYIHLRYSFHVYFNPSYIAR